MATSIVGLKTVTYAKISPEMVNASDIAGESRRRRRSSGNRHGERQSQGTNDPPTPSYAAVSKQT